MAAKSIPLLTVAAVVLCGGTSMATPTSGDLVITSPLILQDDHYGSITIAADATYVDCQGHSIIRDTTLPGGNCPDFNPSTCGVVSIGQAAMLRQATKVMHCNIVGAFTVGVFLSNTNMSSVEDSTLNGNVVGVMFSGGKHAHLQSDVATNCGTGFALVGVQDQVYALDLIANQNRGVGFWDIGSKGIQLDRGTFTNNKTGIYLSNTYAASITFNQAFGNRGYGLIVEAAGKTTFQGNSVWSNQGSACLDAIQAGSGASNTWIGNYLATWCGSIPNTH